MKFSCDQETLSYALQKCASISKQSNTFLQNRNIRIDASLDGLAISATDTVSTTATYFVPGATVSEIGTIFVDGASLSAFVSSQRTYIRVNTTPTGRLHVASGSNKMYLGSSQHNFLPVEYDPEDYIATVDGESLRELLKISVMADTGNIVRAFLSGVMLMFDNGYVYALAASSGRAGYAWARANYQDKAQFLLPPLTASRLSYFLHSNDKVRLYRHGGKMFFVTDRFLMSSTEIAGKYPAKEVVQMCSAEQQHKVMVFTQEFMDILKACSVMYNGVKDNALKRIKFLADNSEQVLNITTAEENEVGKMDWQMPIIESKGKSFSFFLSAVFVDTVLNVLTKLQKSDLMYTGDEYTMTLGVSDDTNFAYFASNDLNAIFVIAPMLGPPEKLDTVVYTTDETNVDEEVF